MPLRTLDELRPYLDLPTLNTGKEFTVGGRSGVVANDREVLTAMTDENDRIVIQSGQEHPFFAYRGQTQEYLTCVPTLAREKRIEARFLASCRNIAFQDMIVDHPFVRFTMRSTFLDKPLHVDIDGLAQHYGFATDMLDLITGVRVNLDFNYTISICQL